MATLTSADEITAFNVLPLTSTVGAEISGIDLAAPIREIDARHLRDALFRWGVIYFHDQELNPAQYLAFAKSMGEVEEKATLAHVEGFPSIGRLVKEADHVTSIGDMWHVDHSYMATPMNITMLHAVEIPPQGGDTLFAHAGNAFATLPDPVKQTLRGLRSIHKRTYLIKDRKYAAQYFKERPPENPGHVQDEVSSHPCVRIHEESGEEVLFVNPGYTVRFDGWTRELSSGLLGSLFEHMLKPENQCRLRWRKGMVAMWDNRVVWHHALNDYHGFRREMHRIVIS